MSNFICAIVPPHILQDIVDGDDEEASNHAQATLDTQQVVHGQRANFFDSISTNSQTTSVGLHNIVPDYILEDLLKAEGVHQYVTQYAEESLAANRQLRDSQTSTTSTPPVKDESSTIDSAPIPTIDAAPTTATVKASDFIQSIYDMESQMPADVKQDIMPSLPGKLIHSEGQQMPTDPAALQVYQNTLKVLQFFHEIFQYNSLNGQGIPVVSSVHFKKNLQNAYWIGVEPDRVYNQMVYGDGGGPITNLTNCIDIIGHEMTHAITHFNSDLTYDGESGALNEHISDVFGVMVKQWSENTKSKDADWLIGEGCFMEKYKGIAFRNMKDPGTAYDKVPDYQLGGKDPQPADYKALLSYQRDWRHTTRLARDNNGAHIFSGVPNRAFVLSCLAFDGYSWEKAGQIWWKTVTTHRITGKCTFLEFADATVSVAQESYGESAARIVRDAWDQVQVVKA